MARPDAHHPKRRWWLLLFIACACAFMYQRLKYSANHSSRHEGVIMRKFGKGSEPPSEPAIPEAPPPQPTQPSQPPAHPPPASPVPAEHEQLLNKPVIVALKGSHFFGNEYARTVDHCTYQGRPLTCIYRDSSGQPDPEADATWFHIPTSSLASRDAPHQLTVAMSMEASTYYTNLNDVGYMDMFDIEMTYRQCAHVPVHYFYSSEQEIQNKMFADPLPFEDKLDAVAYINSNCGALNQRNEIVMAMMDTKRIEVHAWGQCLKNKQAGVANLFDKKEVFRKYKFCIAMENSNTADYVTEKIWQTYESGCVPIYQGAPNIMDYVPHQDSFIDWHKYGGNASLMVDDLVRIMRDKSAYAQMHAWRYKPLAAQLPGFRKQVARITPEHTQCSLCKVIMDHRLGKRALAKTHCMRNATWLEAVRIGGSTWGPGSDALLSVDKRDKWSKTGVWDPFNEVPLGQPRGSASTV